MSAEDQPEAPRIGLFVVGAMKAATTSMCEWLDAQPGVSVSRPKEPSLFVSDDAVAQGLPGLATLFAHASPGDVLVDGSTDYAKFPLVDGVPERVTATFPDARIVYLMRHPVDRLVSQYRFEWYLGARKRPLGQELDLNPQLSDNSRYARQLERWLRCVAPDRVLLVFAEAFGDDPAREVARVLDFAGVAHQQVVTPVALRDNESSKLVRRTLARRLLRRSWVGRRLRPLAPGWLVRRYNQRLHDASRPDMTDDVRALLEVQFDDDLRALQQLTGGPELSCGNWREVAETWTPVLKNP